MAIDISLEGLQLEHNGISSNTNGVSGLLSITWFHCRPDLTEPVVKWTIKLDDIVKNKPVSLEKFEPYNLLAFRQNAVGKSVLKIEVITTVSYILIAKLVVGVITLGIKTVGDLIVNPIASSLFDTFVSQSKMDLNNPTIYKIGTAEYIFDPNSILPGSINLSLEMDKEFVIIKESVEPVTQVKTDKLAIPKGKTGTVTINISTFDPHKPITKAEIAKLAKVQAKSQVLS